MAGYRPQELGFCVQIYHPGESLENRSDGFLCKERRRELAGMNYPVLVTDMSVQLTRLIVEKKADAFS